MKIFAKPILFLLGAVVLVLTTLLLLVESKIITSGPSKIEVIDFETCAEKTGVVMESYPRQCIYNSVNYTEEIPESDEDNTQENTVPPTDEGKQTGSSSPITVQENNCVVAGCSSQLCISAEEQTKGGGTSTCEFLDSYMCYRSASCEIQSTGECGWTEDVALITCLNSFD